jgi:hypothetical protein
MRKQALWQAVTRLTTIAGLTASMIGSAAADNLLFYNQNTGVAAVGHVANDGAYWDVRSLAYDRGWTNIVCATNGTLLFYNRSTGQAASARIAADGSHTDLQSLNLSPGWSHIIPLSGSKLLFYQRNTGAMSTGVLYQDGSFVDLRDIPNITSGWDFIVELGNGTLLFHNNQVPNGKAGTGRIAPDGSFVAPGAFETFGGWPQVTPFAVDNALVYESVFGTAGLVTVKPGTYVAPKKVTGMKGGWDFVVNAGPNVLLGYNYSTGEMVTGSLAGGSGDTVQFVPRLSGRFDPRWSHIVPLR